MKTNINKRIHQLKKNKYVILILVLVIWIVFIDDNSLWNQRELRKELEELQETKLFYEEKIKSYEAQIKELKDKETLEKYAREKYHMKKEDEVIYLIEMDSSN
mgnify:CR=1 FL=1